MVRGRGLGGVNTTRNPYPNPNFNPNANIT